jgi:hypothetical protein
MCWFNLDAIVNYSDVVVVDYYCYYYLAWSQVMGFGTHLPLFRGEKGEWCKGAKT